jgi:hypothetical protein
MNELTEREKAYIQTARKEYRSADSYSEILENDKNNQEWFGYAYDLQQSKIDELVNALEEIKAMNISGSNVYSASCAVIEIAHEALDKHKKYKEGGE